MSALSKADLAVAICGIADVDKHQAASIVECFFETLKEQLAAGKDVKFSGFGNFNLRDKKARPGCNPRTGERVTIQPRRVVTFKAGEKLKEKLREH